MSSQQAPTQELETRLTALFSEDAARLAGMARHLLGAQTPHEDAHEALQNAFLRCWENRDRLAEVQNLRAFVYTAVVNATRDLQRRQRVRREVPVEDLGQFAALQEAAPGKAMEDREIVALCRRAIGQLSQLDREVFLLRQNGELTYVEIAAATGMALGTVKTRMRRSLAQLRAALRGRTGLHEPAPDPGSAP